MGHTKPKDLLDMQAELNVVRAVEGMREKSPNVFYFKSKPFLHFHDKDGKRWADVMVDGAWKFVDCPFGLPARARKAFLKEVLAVMGTEAARSK